MSASRSTMPAARPAPSSASPPGSAAPRAARLGNGRWTTWITERGTGVLRLDGEALTRWVPDPIDDVHGTFVYLRDRESGALWSAGIEPTRSAAERYEAAWEPGLFTITRRDDGVETRLEVFVAADAAAEIRRITLRNLGERVRTIELTTYAEVVLQDPRADASHPAFSKLFVETSFDAGVSALLARRRPRDARERHPWLVHALHGPGDLERESDRARFLGRGHTPARPRALVGASPLSGTVGDVLDPVLSLRRAAAIAPGERVDWVCVFAADADRDHALALADRFRTGHAVDEARKRARRAAHDSDPAETLADAVMPVVGEAWRTPPGAEEAPAPATVHSAERSARPGLASEAESESLLFWNGYGGFAPDGREYVVRLEALPDGTLRRPPLPWINVLANPDFGALISETGAGPTWSGNSREHRLTPWSNDPVLDPHGEATYLRDDASGRYWSVLSGPAPARVDYEMRHGFGYSVCRHAQDGLAVEATLFVPPDDPVKVTRVRIRNTGRDPRRLSLVAYQRLVLGVSPETDARHVVTDAAEGPATLFARNPRSPDFASAVAFAAVVAERGVTSFTCDRASFIGRHRGPDAPSAMADGRLDGRAGRGLDPCFAQAHAFDLGPGESVEVSFLLGESPGTAAARATIARYRAPGAVDQARTRLEAHWRGVLDGMRVRTPSPAVDLMVNGWLAYQTLACRIWGRTAFYQSGGAFGFRDQLQDAAALVSVRPDLTRAQILLHAAHQFTEGDVLHWWHPPSGRGIRTRFADDLLWLPLVLARYVSVTGDWSILEERARFISAPSLPEGEDEAYLLPEDSGERADLYEHACRAIDRSLLTGRHGLPLFGSGDWNDGMNRVGREGRGESVWMGFFLHTVLGDVLPLCRRRHDTARIGVYERYRARLVRALNQGGWDGGWYRRGYFDDGSPLGSASSDECRIDALAQAWAVLSGAAPRERAEQAMDAVERHLISEPDGIIRLLAPPFERTTQDPGYIKGYPPGVRENGGQYTHAALWVVQAMAELGRGDRAARLLEMLSPVRHAASPAEACRYQAEPYVVAADVYGVDPHVGRGGWTWYTGSSGWMLRVAIESVLGLRIEAGRFAVLRPCIPAEWDGFSIDYRLPGEATRYAIHVTRTGPGPAVRDARADGAPVDVDGGGAARIPLVHDGAVHRVDVVLG